MKLLGNQAAAFRAGITGKPLPGWCPPGSLVAKSYRNGRAFYRSVPFQIEIGEWYFKGCFIQKHGFVQLPGKYNVFKDDQSQTHVGFYSNFKEAKKACNDNEVKKPYLGILKFI
jgi:hypothetical protein